MWGECVKACPRAFPALGKNRTSKSARAKANAHVLNQEAGAVFDERVAVALET